MSVDSKGRHKPGTKFCKDCKWLHVKRGWLGDHYHYCKHDHWRDPVTGGASYLLCSIARGHDNGCGPDGLLWEAS